MAVQRASSLESPGLTRPDLARLGLIVAGSIVAGRILACAILACVILAGLPLTPAAALGLSPASLGETGFAGKGLASAILRAERQSANEASRISPLQPDVSTLLAALAPLAGSAAAPSTERTVDEAALPAPAPEAPQAPNTQTLDAQTLDEQSINAQTLDAVGLTALGTQLGDLVRADAVAEWVAPTVAPAVARADALAALIALEGANSDTPVAIDRSGPVGQQLASLSPPPIAGQDPTKPTALVLTLVGDVGLAENRRLRTAKSAASWAPYTKDLAPLIDGDLNFLNLETVVTDRPLSARSKAFAFQTHDTALQHLVQDLGFNLLSLANNHSGDFRRAGQVATLAALEKHAPDAIYHGLGTQEQLLKVREFRLKGMTIAFAAIGISSGAPRPEVDQPGQFFIRRDQDWQAVIRAFQASDADLKILSVHEGQEKISEVEGSLKRKLRQARDEAGVDLIVGHHPHVARAIERDEEGRLIAYSLGNGLLFGAADIDNRPLGRDFGLFLRLHYWFDGKALSLEAVEGVALRGMHNKVRPRSARQAAKRLRFLNGLSARTSGKQGLQFDITDKGQGLWCHDAPVQGERAKALCR